MNRATVLAAVRSALPSLRPADSPQLVSVDALLEERARRHTAVQAEVVAHQRTKAELAEAKAQLRAQAAILTAIDTALAASQADRNCKARQVEQLVADRSTAGQRHQATRDELDAMRARAEGAEQRIADAVRAFWTDDRPWQPSTAIRMLQPLEPLAPATASDTSPPAAGTTEAATAAGDQDVRA